MIKLNIPAIAAKDAAITAETPITQPEIALDIDPSATKRLRALKTQQNNKNLKLRIQIRGGGCSGFQYRFELTEDSKPDDHRWTQDGAEFLVDPLSQQMLNGAQLEYFTSPMESGFRLNNPHAKSSCGCGVSFSVG